MIDSPAEALRPHSSIGIWDLKKKKDEASFQSVHFFFARFHSISCGLDDGKTSKPLFFQSSYFVPLLSDS